TPHSVPPAYPFTHSLPSHPRPHLFPYTTLFRSHWIHARSSPRGQVTGYGGNYEQNHRGGRDGQRIGRLQSIEQTRHRLGQHKRRSEEHTSELQSRFELVCRLLLEKKKRRSRIKA